MDRSLEFWVFFAVGLAVVIAASIRQFDEPSWPAEGGSRIRGLPPSDIVDRWKFHYAFVVYVLIIVSIYGLLCLSARAVEVLVTAVNVYLGQNAERVQVGAVFGSSEDVHNSVELVSGLPEMRTRPEFPLLVAIALGLLLRFPVAQRAERFLRRSTHALFGIPAAPERLHQQALATRLDVDRLDAAIAAVGDDAFIARRLEAYAGAAQAAIGAGFRREPFERSVGKMLAYRYWVAERRVWPSPGVIDGSATLTEWNRRVQDDIVALERDMALLSDPSIVWLPPDADDNQRTLQVKMRQERWEDLVRHAERLGDEVCSLVVLFDQRSDLPDTDSPLGSVIDGFLDAVHKADDSRRRVLRTGLWAVGICIAINAAVGFLYGLQLRNIAFRDHADAIAAGFAAPNPWTFARDWALTGLVAFGLTTWLAIAWREGRRRRRRWINVFERRQPLWPIEKWLGVFVVCAVTVCAIYLVYLTMIGLLFGADRIADIGRDLLIQMRRNLEVSLLFGAMAGLHGVFVAILMDIGPAQMQRRRWISILAVHAIVVGIAAWAVAHFVSVQAGSSAEVAALRSLSQVAAAVLIAAVVGLTLVLARVEALAVEQQSSDDRSEPPADAPTRSDPAEMRVVALGRTASIGLAAFLLLAAGPGHAQPAVLGTVDVGMRSDAKPFAYRNSLGMFDGYLVTLCRRAVILAGYRIGQEVDLLAESRFDPEVDLICDPTTLTLARAERWDFSPVVFVANATFVEFDRAEPLAATEAAGLAGCAAGPGQAVFAAGMVDNTTAFEAFDAAMALPGVLSAGPDAVVCPLTVPSHVDGIARLCRGELRYYFGDTDILRAYILDAGDDCAARVLFHPTFRTYEPYAFAMPSSDAEFRRRFTRAIYELFASREADGYFRDDPYFEGRPQSEALRMLFRLNRIPRGVPEPSPEPSKAPANRSWRSPRPISPPPARP